MLKRDSPATLHYGLFSTHCVTGFKYKVTITEDSAAQTVGADCVLCLTELIVSGFLFHLVAYVLIHCRHLKSHMQAQACSNC